MRCVIVIRSRHLSGVIQGSVAEVSYPRGFHSGKSHLALTDAATAGDGSLGLMFNSTPAARGTNVLDMAHQLYIYI